jgi:hypothetical protein
MGATGFSTTSASGATTRASPKISPSSARNGFPRPGNAGSASGRDRRDRRDRVERSSRLAAQFLRLLALGQLSAGSVDVDAHVVLAFPPRARRLGMPVGEAQWRRDPTRRHELRWWNGQRWTEHVADGGVVDVDWGPKGPPEGWRRGWSPGPPRRNETQLGSTHRNARQSPLREGAKPPPRGRPRRPTTACAYCMWQLSDGDAIQVCASCRTPYHAECFLENNGCAVFGCPAWLAQQMNGGGAAAVAPTGSVPPDTQRSVRPPPVGSSCPECGADVTAGWRFCGRCGRQLESVAAR